MKIDDKPMHRKMHINNLAQIKNRTGKRNFAYNADRPSMYLVRLQGGLFVCVFLIVSVYFALFSKVMDKTPFLVVL